MSVFNAPTTEQSTDTTASTEDTQDTTENFLEQVVTEKGEHWKDPETLAKGYAHAQQRIKELESLSEKYKEQDYAKSLLEQLQERQATATPSDPPADPNNQGSTDTSDVTSLTSEDIERLLESKLSERSKQDKVETALRAKFGDQANRIVHKRAEEMNLSIDRMKEIASESPEAFLRLIGEPDKQQTNSTRESTVNTSSGFDSHGKDRNAAYYSKLRRENRKLYNSPTTQVQMLEDRKRLGDKYYT